MMELMVKPVFCCCDKNIWQRQLRGGRVCFCSQLKGVVHLGRDVMRQELEEATGYNES